MTIVFAVLGIFAGLMLLLQLLIALGSRRQRGRRIQLVGGAMGEAIMSGDRVLAYFYTTTCAESQAMTPIIDRLQGEYANVFKVNVAEQFEAARAFGVTSTPTTIVVESGKVVDILVGSHNEAHLREALL